jgi:hypothetical protein
MMGQVHGRRGVLVPSCLAEAEQVTPPPPPNFICNVALKLQKCDKSRPA